MGEYHDLYLKSDVLLSADVFENFRKTCMQYYEPDPCHCFTSPGLTITSPGLTINHWSRPVIMMAGGRIFDVLLLFLFFRVSTSCEKVCIF